MLLGVIRTGGFQRGYLEWLKEEEDGKKRKTRSVSNLFILVQCGEVESSRDVGA